MRKTLTRGVLAVSLLSLAAGGVLAQTPPSALSGVPGLSYEGQIGGMDVWSAPGSPELFAITPDGRTLMRGSIFSGSGRDIGAALTGAEPATLLPDAAQRAATAPAGPDANAPVLMVNTNPARSFESLMGPDSCQSPILAEGPVAAPRVAGWDGQGRGNPPAGVPSVNPNGVTAAPPLLPTDEIGLVDGAEIAREAQDALAGFDQAERRELLLGLVEELRDAQTQEQFLAAIASWRAEIDRMRQDRGLSRLYSEDGTQPLPPVASATPATALMAPPEVDVEALAPAHLEVAADEASLEQTLLEDVRYNALWFSVGPNDAPSVYAFIDPTCSYSARAISALSGKVGAGELQLRVILAPVLSERSAGLIAGILTDERPPLAFFDHEVGLAERGRSDLEPAAFSDLPGPIQAGIQRNFEMIRDYGIPGVPFFVYETAEGARVLSGAPDGIDFPGALNDPYTGTK
jgi:hypothetical protein